MKTKLFSRSIAMLLCLSLLFTGFAIPASTTTISNSVASSDEFKIDENIIKDDDQVVFEKKPISSDDIAISNESMILKYVDSSQFNEAKHTQRLTELEELNTYVFDNVDGTRSVYVMHENVKYIDENGSIKEKDVSLISKKGGFGTVQNDIELLIPNNPTQGIDIEYSEFAVKLIPQDLTDKISAKQTDNSIVYEKAYGEKTKLIYTPLLSGVKEDIILTEYTSDASYTFVLKTDGLNLYKNDNGYYLSKDSKADPVFFLGDIVVYDAIGKPDIGTMTVQTVTAGEEYLLTVTANDDFLSDPTTVYPVTIDPSITVSENNADNSIIDAPIYQGYPDRNFATYTYNRVGTPSGNNGIGRTAVKLSGLTSQSAYQTITASQITDVTFHVREASGGSAQYINIYPLTSNTTWTETSMTWNSVGNWSTTLNCGNTMNGAQWTAFNITNLVKAWKNNTYSANAGFIMISNNESVDKSFCSSEYSSNTSYRPYVVMTYNPVISLNYSSLSIVEGGTSTLIATTQPSGQTVTWTTSNSAIATVSSTGVITAHKAGDIAIRAKIVDADGVSHYATCTVYVYIPNGVYYIKNLNSYYYLHVKSGGISNYTDVCQYPKYLDYESNQYKIRQMWKTYYLGDGRYSIRPMNKLDKGLDVTGTNVDIYDIGSSDTLSGVESYGEWTISWYSTGYVLKNAGNNAKTMQVQNASNASEATVVASDYLTSVNCRWDLIKVSSPPSGVYWYDINRDTILQESSTTTQIINCGSAVNVDDMGLIPVMYSPTSINQTFMWSTADDSIASVNATSGLISANEPGEVIITATSSYGGYELLLKVLSKSTDPFHYHNIQNMRCTRITGVNWWGIGAHTDHTVNIIKSTLLSDDYCIVHDNINTGYYREIYINDELKNFLNDLEEGFQEHYSVIPLFNTVTDEENSAHIAKGETDQLVEAGYFSCESSEYYGTWAYSYVSAQNLLDLWRGALNTATAVFNVYLAVTSFYNSYLMSINATTTQVTFSQYTNTASVLDDISDAMHGVSYSGKTVTTAEVRNTSLAAEGYTNPLPYKPQTPVVGYQQTSTTQYVRVFREGNKNGRWLMKYSDVQGLTPKQIQGKFALTKEPTHYCFVDVPAGTTVYVGVVNESTVSNTLQFELGSLIPNSAYGPSIVLP